MNNEDVNHLITYSAALFMWILGISELLISLPYIFNLPFGFQFVLLFLCGLMGVIGGILTTKQKFWKITLAAAILSGLPCLGAVIFLISLNDLYLPFLIVGFVFLVVGVFPTIIILESKNIFSRKQML